MQTTAAQDERFAQLSQQALDFVDLPGGGQRAVLTVTLPGGKQYTYTEDVHPDEAAKVEGLYDEVGALLDAQVGSIFGDIAKGLKKVAKGAVHVVRDIAHSKVFATAAKGLALIAPALGPLAPAALATSATMGIASKLTQARVAAKRGNKTLAAKITASAVKSAQSVAPKNSATLLRLANTKSSRASALSVGKPTKAKPLATPVTRTTFPTSSSSPTRVTSRTIMDAARKGNVYLIRA